MRASDLDDGDVLIVAQPLGDTGSTLHHLLLVELAVTGGAVVMALVGGLWLVRIGLRPLRDMERRPSPSPPATSPSGCRVRTTPPRWAAWPAPST